MMLNNLITTAVIAVVVMCAMLVFCISLMLVCTEKDNNVKVRKKGDKGQL